MIILVSKAVGLTIDIILVLVFGGFLAYNIYKLVLRIKEKKAKKKNKSDDETLGKEK